MRRNDKEIQDRAQIDALIRACRVCRLGLADGGVPYVVPVCYGYDGQALYFHGAGQGRKIDILRRNNRVCFEIDRVEHLVEAPEACRWGVRYRSVIGTGTAEIVEDLEAKRHGLATLMAAFSGRRFDFPEEAVRGTCVVKVTVLEVTGKQSPDLPALPDGSEDRGGGPRGTVALPLFPETRPDAIRPAGRAEVRGTGLGGPVDRKVVPGSEADASKPAAGAEGRGPEARGTVALPLSAEARPDTSGQAGGAQDRGSASAPAAPDATTP